MSELSLAEAWKEAGKIALIAGEMALRSITVRVGTFCVSSSYAIPMAVEHPGINYHTAGAVGLVVASGVYGWCIGRQPLEYYDNKYPQSPRLHQ